VTRGSRRNGAHSNSTDTSRREKERAAVVGALAGLSLGLREIFSCSEPWAADGSVRSSRFAGLGASFQPRARSVSLVVTLWQSRPKSHRWCWRLPPHLLPLSYPPTVLVFSSVCWYPWAFPLLFFRLFRPCFLLPLKPVLS